MAMNAAANPNENDPPGQVVRTRFMNFIREFAVGVEVRESESDAVSPHQIKEYMLQIDQMKDYDQATLHVDFKHLQGFDVHLASTIAEEYYRFDPFLRMALQTVIKERHPDFANVEGELRDFFVSFFHMPSELRVRDLNTREVGALVAFSGTVTRTSEVRPELLYGCFSCEECGTSNDGIEQQFKYTEPSFCRNPQCTNRSRWKLQLDRSRFVDWQRVRVQENADEIPPGSMPRSVDVILRHGAVERAKAGDKCVFTGSLVVVPDVGQLMKAGVAPKSYSQPSMSRQGANQVEGVTGLQSLGVRDLTYRTAFIACSVQRDGQQGLSSPDADEGGEVAVADEFTEEERADFHREVKRHGSGMYQRVVRSIAPTVFGHEEVKRGVLLMLLGGVHKRTHEGIRLRGDINVCVVGDPSTAKSQFLKFVVKFLPRAVYTSGKASSAAGLTASVARDPDTGEFTIEAGALMLADNGVCCIDEFDKMESTDQVAIHEAMEQQTISITKAGIQATLNARTSILAAANPVFGRYDRSKTLRQNVSISPPIMSRFDLLFIVLDDCDETQDYNIAKHIVNVHQYKGHNLDPDYSTSFLKRYLRYGRTFQPRFTDAAAKAAVACYRRLRQSDAVGASQSAYRITVRQLESLIRLSEALARLHLSNEVTEEYVLESFRLLRKNVIHVESGQVMLDEGDELGGGGTSRADGGDGSEGGGATPPASASQDGKSDEPAPARKTQITFEEYQRMARLVASYIRSNESEENGGAVRQGDVVAWYLEQRNLDSVQALVEERLLLNKVIARLITRDNLLVVVQHGEIVDPADSTATEAEDRLIALHPDAVLPAESVNEDFQA